MSSADATDSFNARNLSPAEVARTFVPPAEFTSLVQQANAIVVGPRGSGKTTLLKMLLQEALETWDHALADTLASRVTYTTAFVGTDRRWSAQLASLGESRLTSESRARYALAAYTTQVLRSVTNAMIGRTGLAPGNSSPVNREVGRVSLSVDAEADLTGLLSSAWGLKPRLPSLIAVRQALTLRLLEIKWLASQAPLEDLDPTRRAWLTLPFLDAVVTAVEGFNDLVGEPQRRWALALDELEIAPPAVLDELATAIRASDEIILFKLALSPGRHLGGHLATDLAASPGHDYSEIRLWYPDRRDGEAFCRDLWRAALARRGLPDLDPRSVLGPSYFEGAPGPNGNEYEPGSKWAIQFQELAADDQTFREYLRNKRIDVTKLDAMRDPERAADVRKIAPLLPLRAFYRQPDRDRRRGRLRSRKSPALYTGAACMFAITEANPRWFKNLFDGLLDVIVDSRIDAEVQARSIGVTSQRFAALLNTVPAPTIHHRGTARGVLGVIREIARSIQAEHVTDAFKPEPRATFTVPADADQTLVDILQEAANWGGIIFIPDTQDQGLIGSLRKKRFRISYLLAPLYGLPVRLGKPLSLKPIFSRRSAEVPTLFEGQQHDQTDPANDNASS
ncbi:MAG: hypothetical protein HUU26_00360 [Gemmatimonadaceae bacterium]|nr:hypothetical protein [Gemmatimonadaceae bacterium]